MITCYFENENKTSLRHVTVNAIIIRDNKILLCKRGSFNGKPILESGKWALIGGFFDRDETLIEAAKREALEETGWIIDNLKLFRIVDSPERPKEDRQNVEFVFIAEAISNSPTSTEEVRELKWFGLDELPPMDQMAFDHGSDIELYKKYLKENVVTPILG